MSLSITPTLIIAAAQKRGWRVTVLSETASLYRLDLPDGRYFYVRGITSIKSHAVNTIIADNKYLLQVLAPMMSVDIPATQDHTHDMQAAVQFLHTHKQIVVKPTNQSHGTGVTINVASEAALAEAITFAQQYSDRVVLQQQVTGDDYRVLMIDNQIAAAAIRKPAFVVGDGQHTIRELIDLENASGKRSDGYHGMLCLIDVSSAERYLGDAIRDIPAKDVEVRVVGTANIGKGGASIDMTDRLGPEIAAAAHKVADHLDIGLAGVDFMVTAEGKPYLIEINTTPSLGLHELPYDGKPRNTPDAFLDWLAKV